MNGRTFVRTGTLSGDDGLYLIVFGPDGTQVDSLPDPSSTYEPPMLSAERRDVSPSGQPTRASTTGPVPFSPELLWTVHPSGHFLTGLSSDYRVDLARDDGVLRIERAADPVPVHDEERAYERDRVVENMRDMDPDWSWNGPPIPEHKPFFHELLAGRDGRIWVWLAPATAPIPEPSSWPGIPTEMPREWKHDGIRAAPPGSC